MEPAAIGMATDASRPPAFHRRCEAARIHAEGNQGAAVARCQIDGGMRTGHAKSGSEIGRDERRNCPPAAAARDVAQNGRGLRRTVRADTGVARAKKGDLMEVVIYTNTGCSACHQAKEFVARHNVSYVEKTIRKHPSLINELASTGFRAVPVIRVGDETMLGFSAVKLRRMQGL